MSLPSAYGRSFGCAEITSERQGVSYLQICVILDMHNLPKLTDMDLPVNKDTVIRKLGEGAIRRRHVLSAQWSYLITGVISPSSAIDLRRATARRAWDSADAHPPCD